MVQILHCGVPQNQTGGHSITTWTKEGGGKCPCYIKGLIISKTVHVRGGGGGQKLSKSCPCGY